MFTSTMPMNTEWFRQKLAERKLSQRQLAKLMGLDPAAVSLMLRDQRKMTNEEAHFIASTIGVPVTEVLRRAGIEVLDDVRAVPIRASMNDGGSITLFPEKTYERVHGPADCPSGTHAIQVRAPTTVQDGWLLFISPAQQDATELFDRICLVTLKSGQQCIAVVRRGYRQGTFNLITWPDREQRMDVEIAWASHVLWIKPS
jgi:transcriptional regulator with XRE-family HTH domain